MTSGEIPSLPHRPGFIEKRHPALYLQGSGVLTEIVPLLEDEATLVVAGKRGWEAVQQALGNGPVPIVNDAEPFIVLRASDTELARALELCERRGCRRVLAAGGGRAIDLGKACAFEAGLSCTVVPTVLGTDAACSSVAVLYDEGESFLRYVDHRRNPASVIVDLDVLRDSPRRYFAAGVVGALAVFYEAEERIAGGGFHAPASLREHHLEQARQARERFLALDAEGLRAPARLRQEDLADLTYLALWASADLFENVGLSLAHAVYRGLRGVGLSGREGYLHGELVGLGLLCQLRLCPTHRDELEAMTAFVARALGGTDWPALHKMLQARRDLYGEQLSSFAAGEHTTSRPDPRRIVETTLEVSGSL